MSNRKKDYTDPLFEQLLKAVPVRLRKETERSYGIAERIDAVLKQKGLSKTDLARMTGKKNAEVSKWLRAPSKPLVQKSSKPYSLQKLYRYNYLGWKVT